MPFIRLNGRNYLYLRKITFNMRTILKIAIAFAMAAGLSSCGAARKIAADAPFRKDIVLFDPVSRIDIVGRQNLKEKSETVSADAQNLLKDKLCTFDSGVEISSIYVPEKLEEAFAIQDDIMVLAQWYIETDGGDLKYITIPETIDRIIEESGHRYGMVVYSEGYSRTGGNYALEVVKTIGIGILTGWVSAPYKDETHLYLMILDSDTDRIVYNRHCFGEYNPLKDKHIEKALKRTFSDFAD